MHASLPDGTMTVLAARRLQARLADNELLNKAEVRYIETLPRHSIMVPVHLEGARLRGLARATIPPLTTTSDQHADRCSRSPALFGQKRLDKGIKMASSVSEQSC
jgi:hypothetical protein